MTKHKAIRGIKHFLDTPVDDITAVFLWDCEAGRFLKAFISETSDEGADTWWNTESFIPESLDISADGLEFDVEEGGLAPVNEGDDHRTFLNNLLYNAGLPELNEDSDPALRFVLLGMDTYE